MDIAGLLVAEVVGPYAGERQSEDHDVEKAMHDLGRHPEYRRLFGREGRALHDQPQDDTAASGSE